MVIAGKLIIINDILLCPLSSWFLTKNPSLSLQQWPSLHWSQRRLCRRWWTTSPARCARKNTSPTLASSSLECCPVSTSTARSALAGFRCPKGARRRLAAPSVAMSTPSPREGPQHCPWPSSSTTCSRLETSCSG